LSSRGTAQPRFLLVLILCAGLGCATTYSEKIDAARQAVQQGDYQAGIEAMDRVLGVKSHDQLPSRWGSDAALGALERASLLQAVGDYEGSARDLIAAETELELLDLSRDTAGSIGKYVYSDSSAVYEALPLERLALNGINMLNYLALDDLQGARVEARRFTVIRDYLLEVDPEEAQGPFASYLAGFVFEQLGEAGEAARYYDEALQGHRFESLRAPVERLSTRTAYRGKALEPFLSETPRRAPLASAAEQGELLIVIALGRVPFKVPKRVPVGAAVGLAGTFITGDPKVLAYSAFKVVTYPELVPSGTHFRTASAFVDGRSVPVELAGDLGSVIRSQFGRLQPKIIGAALSRMIVRAAAAEGARAAGRQAGSHGDLVGLIAALLMEGTLVGLDKPDTRSWSFLPDTLHVGRRRVAAGEHHVVVEIGGDATARQEFDVDVPAGGFRLILISELR
jgi:tetratricopeptide (TPR) repeat protein